MQLFLKKNSKNDTIITEICNSKRYNHIFTSSFNAAGLISVFNIAFYQAFSFFYTFC